MNLINIIDKVERWIENNYRGEIDGISQVERKKHEAEFFRLKDKLFNTIDEVKVKQVKEKENIDIFGNIVGHDALKTIFNNAIKSDEQIHILLTGAAGTSKSLFLEAVADNIKNSYFINNNSTGAGIMSYLYEHPDLKYLLIDEVEKLSKDEVAVLLTLMESGRLVITKKSMMVNRKQQVKIFATCNNKNRMAPEMLSRFLKFTLKPYTFFEFMQITNNIVVNRFNRTPEFAARVGKAVWESMGSRDIRDIIKVTRLTKNESDIDNIIKALAYYSEETNNGNEDDGEENSSL